MLALTPNAVEAVEAIIAQSDVPDGAAVRITAHSGSMNGTGPQMALLLDVVTDPDPDDAVVEGTPLYVDSATADVLADKVLDAEIEDERVKFTVHPQIELDE
jgi:iron-sulfur cluster assembly protein